MTLAELLGALLELLRELGLLPFIVAGAVVATGVGLYWRFRQVSGGGPVHWSAVTDWENTDWERVDFTGMEHPIPVDPAWFEAEDLLGYRAEDWRWLEEQGVIDDAQEWIDWSDYLQARLEQDGPLGDYAGEAGYEVLEPEYGEAGVNDFDADDEFFPGIDDREAYGPPSSTDHWHWDALAEVDAEEAEEEEAWWEHSF